MALPAPQDPEAAQVGTDVARIECGVLVIYSRRDMPDWVVREYKRPAIWFKGHKFYLREKAPAPEPFCWRYALWPWTPDLLESPPYEIEFNEDYVRERDAEFKGRRTADSVHRALLPLYPLPGFLWSGTKEWLMDFEFHPRSITSVSVMLELGFTLFWGIYVSYLMHGSILNFTILLVLVTGVIFRYDSVLGDKPIQPGFLEWLVRR
jgi:hypothetical protein